MNKYIQLSEEVRSAINAGEPVVALGSTLLAYALPYPLNIETAVAMEAEIRHAGATPATIAVVDGNIRVGLSEEELNRLAQSEDMLKVSSRELAYTLSTKRTAATTASATMWVANDVGIRYFGSGGFGGVDREVWRTGDISTDLVELSHASVAVVCAGVVGLLDVGLTLEYLETVGVPVVGYQTEEFPGFYTESSGYGVTNTVRGPREAADLFKTHRSLGMPSGMVIACSPPVEDEDEMVVKQAIDRALADKDNATQPLLQRVNEYSEGASLRINAALLRNTSRVAAEIAVAETYD